LQTDLLKLFCLDINYHILCDNHRHASYNGVSYRRLLGSCTSCMCSSRIPYPRTVLLALLVYPSALFVTSFSMHAAVNLKLAVYALTLTFSAHRRIKFVFHCYLLCCTVHPGCICLPVSSSALKCGQLSAIAVWLPDSSNLQTSV